MPSQSSAISLDNAKQIALQKIPGTIIDATTETYDKKEVYVIEVSPSNRGPETDVYISKQTGSILHIEQ